MTISVIIPTFNRETLLERAVRSALDQTVSIMELIVVDDGSTDQTESLVARLARADPRIKFIKQERGGANRARNAGSQVAVGDWLAFLDSDDFWEKDKLRLQMLALDEQASAVASFTGLRHVGGKTSRIFIPPANPSLAAIREANVLSSTSTAVVRAAVFQDVGGFDPELPSCQDWDLWFRLRQKGEFAIVQQPLTNYDSGPHERITLNLAKVLDGHEKLFRRLTAGVENDKNALHRISAKHKLVLTEVHLRGGNAGRAFGLCLSSLCSRPTLWGARLMIASGRALAVDLLRGGIKATPANSG